MSNNSWKQYGGKSKLDNLNTISVTTVIADQFLSRSSKPTYQFYNSTIEVAINLRANINLISGNSLYVGVDSYVRGNSYINNKLFFGGNAVLTADLSYATLPSRTMLKLLIIGLSLTAISLFSNKNFFSLIGPT